MPAVRVDDEARTDWRIAMLGRLCGHDRRWALGALVDVWAHCTRKQAHHVTPAALDGLAELEGFSAHLVAADLGELQPDGTIRVRGLTGRIEWYGARMAAARHGGMASAASRANRAQTTPVDNPTVDNSAPAQAADAQNILLDQTPTKRQPNLNQTSTKRQPNANQTPSKRQPNAKRVVKQTPTKRQPNANPLTLPIGTSYQSGRAQARAEGGQKARLPEPDPDPEALEGPQRARGATIPGSITPDRTCADCGRPGSIQEHHRWLCISCRFGPARCAELDAEGA